MAKGRSYYEQNTSSITIRGFDDNVGISFGSSQVISIDVLGLKRAIAKIVPKLLNFEQKQRHMDIAQDVDDVQRRSRFVEIVITGDESWVYDYAIVTKVQSSQ